MVKAVARPSLDNIANFTISGKAGDCIFHDGDAGTEMYIVWQGRIGLVKEHAGATRSLAVLEAGDFFGETSLLEQQPRAATARALTDYQVLRIDSSTFEQIVDEDPQIAVLMLRKLSRRLRERQHAEPRSASIAQGHPAVPRGGKMTPIDLAVQGRSGSSQPVRRAALLMPSSDARFTVSDDAESTIGRADRRTGFVPTIDLSVLDVGKTLSRRHATIVKRDGEFYLREEKKASNGTFVNGRRIGTGVETKLNDGDRIGLGLLELIFQYR